MLVVEYQTILVDLFPSIESLTVKPQYRWLNTIEVRKIIVYGREKSGKTELVRKLAEMFIERYGLENCNIVSSRNADYLMKSGLDQNKLVNVLVWEDATLQKIDRETASRFFRIRHLMTRKTGLIVAIVICHRLHGIPIEFRTEPDYILFKSLPIGYDKSVVKRFVGNRGIRYLQEIIANGDRSKTLVYDCRRDEAQTIELPLARRNYLRTLYPRKVGLGLVGKTVFIGWLAFVGYLLFSVISRIL